MAIKEGGKVDNVIRFAGVILAAFFIVLCGAYDSALFGYLALGVVVATMLHVVLVSEGRW